MRRTATVLLLAAAAVLVAVGGAAAAPPACQEGRFVQAARLLPGSATRMVTDDPAWRDVGP